MEGKHEGKEGNVRLGSFEGNALEAQSKGKSRRVKGGVGGCTGKIGTWGGNRMCWGRKCRKSRTENSSEKIVIVSQEMVCEEPKPPPIPSLRNGNSQSEKGRGGGRGKYLYWARSTSRFVRKKKGIRRRSRRGQGGIVGEPDDRSYRRQTKILKKKSGSTCRRNRGNGSPFEAGSQPAKNSVHRWWKSECWDRGASKNRYVSLGKISLGNSKGGKPFGGGRIKKRAKNETICDVFAKSSWRARITKNCGICSAKTVRRIHKE